MKRLFLSAVNLLSFIGLLTLANPAKADVKCNGNVCDVTPALQDFCNTGWNYEFDPLNLEFSDFYYTIATGSRKCDQATWDYHQFTASRSCAVYVYVPGIFATASIAYGIFDSSGNRIALATVNQNAYSEDYVPIGTWSGIHHVQISNNNGQTDQYIAASEIAFNCK